MQSDDSDWSDGPEIDLPIVRRTPPSSPSVRNERINNFDSDGSCSDASVSDETLDLDDMGNFGDEVMNAKGTVKLDNLIGDRLGPSFLQGDFDWRLRGTLKVECHKKSFYDIVLTFSEGRSEHMQMAVCVQRSPGAGPLLKRYKFKACQVKLELMGKFDKVLATKFIHVDPKQWCQFLDHSSRDISGSYDQLFISKSFGRTLCQMARKPSPSHRLDDEDYEFIAVRVTVDLLISKPQPRARIPGVHILSQSTCTEFHSVPLKRKTEDDQEHWTKRLRTDTSFADVIFKVGPMLSQTFYAHKCILGSRSPVFQAMFNTDMKEAATNEIQIPDVHGNIMSAFLDCLYEKDMSSNTFETATDEAITGSGVIRKYLGVLALAHQYQITEMVTSCVNTIVCVLGDDVNVKVALEIYAAGHKYDILDLKQKGLQCLKANKEQLNHLEGMAVLEEFFRGDTSVAAQLFMGVLFA